jgi:hypothetical protein
MKKQRARLAMFLLIAMAALMLAAIATAPAGAADKIPRTASGRPDLSGFYDAATLTPLVRPEEFGDNLELTKEQAEKILKENRERRAARDANRGAVTEAPPKGGAPPVGVGDEFLESSGAGSVGGYNNFWVDPGNDVSSIDGKFRTSIITDPKNGRMPPMTEAAMKRGAERAKLRRANDGTAWWLDADLEHGPYDGPEMLGIAERCILGFTGAAPTFPSLYNNFKRIVQTDDYVMIEIEMVHDARIVRMNSKHPPAEMRKWLGDSIGWWEGDTLVVDTTNFHPQAGVRGGSQSAHVVERFTRLASGDLLYQFTMNDPSTWTAPWSGEYLWRASQERVWEYACHEGNYAMGNILRGARLLEKEKLERAANGGPTGR